MQNKYFVLQNKINLQKEYFKISITSSLYIFILSLVIFKEAKTIIVTLTSLKIIIHQILL